MNAVPAKVAGVREIVMAVPTPGGERNELVLAAAAICGVDRVFTIGGAQAIAALAFGTATDTGGGQDRRPGQRVRRRRQAAGVRRGRHRHGRGPSEIVVVCDGSTDPDWVAMDLFSQAGARRDRAGDTHRARCRVPRTRSPPAWSASSPSMPRADGHRRVARDARRADPGARPRRRLPTRQPHRAGAPRALGGGRRRSCLPKIRARRRDFLGRYTSEALGDYCAGPNHVLPTSRTARFSSPLGVYDFQKRSSVIRVSRKAAAQARGRSPRSSRAARGCTAHAQVGANTAMKSRPAADATCRKSPEEVIRERDPRAEGLPRPGQLGHGEARRDGEPVPAARAAPREHRPDRRAGGDQPLPRPDGGRG